MATANPPRASLSRKLLGSSSTHIWEQKIRKRNIATPAIPYLWVIPKARRNYELDFLS